MQGKEEDEESVGCATEAEPEGDDATEVDATTECGEETVLGPPDWARKEECK